MRKIEGERVGRSSIRNKIKRGMRINKAKL